MREPYTFSTLPLFDPDSCVVRCLIICVSNDHHWKGHLNNVHYRFLQSIHKIKMGRFIVGCNLAMGTHIDWEHIITMITNSIICCTCWNDMDLASLEHTHKQYNIWIFQCLLTNSLSTFCQHSPDLNSDEHDTAPPRRLQTAASGLLALKLFPHMTLTSSDGYKLASTDSFYQSHSAVYDGGL